MDEERLLRRLRRGDQRPLELFMKQYGSYVYTVTRNRCRRLLPEEDLEEIVSDAFVALWQNAGAIEPGHVKQWLGSVARNKTVDRLRQQHMTVPLEDDRFVVDDTLWSRMALQERHTMVSQALARLSDEDREIFFRYYDLCQTAQEISETMGINASTVRTRLSRGREKLKQILLEGGYIHEDDL